MNTPIDDNRSHLLRVVSRVLCELDLRDDKRKLRSFEATDVFIPTCVDVFLMSEKNLGFAHATPLCVHVATCWPFTLLNPCLFQLEKGKFQQCMGVTFTTAERLWFQQCVSRAVALDSSALMNRTLLGLRHPIANQ